MTLCGGSSFSFFRFRARGLPCWRLAPPKPLLFRWATPTLAPFSQRAAFHVGAAFPASPCSFVGPRQPRRLFLGARPSMLAPCIPQALVPSSGHANRGAVIRARGLPCWRLVPYKPLRLRRATPTPVPRSGLVRARRPAKPMNSVFEREPWNGRRRKSSPDSGSVRLCPYNGVNSKIVLYLFLGGLPFLVSKRAISA